MIRTIIKIDEETCTGCGLCVSACHEGAIEMVNGKARLIKDDYCDGLGDCLPACPTGAITFEQREAAPYDEEAVKARQQAKQTTTPLPCGCPGSQSKAIQRPVASAPAVSQVVVPMESQLMQWPVQIKLVPVNAPYFDGANLLVAADCAAYAHGDFHNQFMKNHITIIGCPKLDAGDYTEKLTAILSQNQIKSVKVVRMEVPCCGGIERAVIQALQQCGKMIPWQVVTLGADGRIVE
ncbi:MAG: 4Fe-4S binding protein [Clostridiales bacterium]|nr:4Fe-4S binding protein [Clostridiales bacterium]